MKCDEVSARQKLVQFDFLDLHLLSLLSREEGIISDNLHFKTTRTVTYDPTNIACTNDAKRFIGELNAHKLRLLPLSSMGRRAGFRNLACHGKHHRNRMLGGCDHVAKRRVHHDHTFLRGSVFVDVVGTDPGASDHFELMRVFQNGRGNSGRGTDGEAIVLANHGGQGVFVFAKLGAEIHLDATVAENLDSGFAEFIGNEYFGSHGERPSM